MKPDDHHPIYEPMTTASRVVWTLITLGAVGYAVAMFAAVLTTP